MNVLISKLNSEEHNNFSSDSFRSSFLWHMGSSGAYQNCEWVYDLAFRGYSVCNSGEKSDRKPSCTVKESYFIRLHLLSETRR